MKHISGTLVVKRQENLRIVSNFAQLSLILVWFWTA